MVTYSHIAMVNSYTTAAAAASPGSTSSIFQSRTSEISGKGFSWAGCHSCYPSQWQS